MNLNVAISQLFLHVHCFPLPIVFFLLVWISIFNYILFLPNIFLKKYLYFVFFYMLVDLMLIFPNNKLLMEIPKYTGRLDFFYYKGFIFIYARHLGYYGLERTANWTHSSKFIWLILSQWCKNNWSSISLFISSALL